MKILVIKFRNIGDVLLTTPLIKNLKLNYPDAKIDMVVNRGTESMIELNPNINEIFTYDRNFYKSMPKLKRVIEEFRFLRTFRDYDMVINTTEGDRGAFIAKFSKAKIKIGYKVTKNMLLKNTFTHTLSKPPLIRHIIENNLDALRVVKKDIHTKKVEIFWDEKDKNRIDELHLDEFIHIHPVSRWLFKCIKDELMAEIIDFLEDRGKKVVITASPDKKEMKKVENILNLCRTKPINLSGKLSLKEVAYLSSKAKLFIGVDTAIMHMAAAVNTPVVAFFGPSGAFNWGPWDNELFESGYTKRGGIQQMGKHTVIQHDWECVPCGKDGCNGTKISDCLMKFDMDKIYKIIESKI
ncbi:MAG: putative lipopolysaccharide heptosyltransferase III [Epsilonproteobacteria bacterium]|nr:putative lipopolysaccharide heptosyltransferase III [Campylobacterota bacterium]